MKNIRFIFIALLGLQLYQVNGERNFNILEEIFRIKIDPDMCRNVSQLISSKGYPVENYDVQTEDGYILTIQHIPHGKNQYNNTNRSQQKKVVLLQHGLLSSASDWVINFSNESLGFILADAGYDVWLGNVRGNTYAQRHIKYTTKDSEFWKFSFDEMAQYDLPAMIDFALKKSGQKQLYYIGHSQGTTMGFAMLSERPEYNKKIKLMVAYGPVATVGHINSAIRFLAPFASNVQTTRTAMRMTKVLQTTSGYFEFYQGDIILVLGNFNAKVGTDSDLWGGVIGPLVIGSCNGECPTGLHEFLPSNIIMKYLSELVCDTEVKAICENIAFLLCGTDESQLNTTRLHVYTAHTPAGTSTQNIVHWAQMVNSNNFQKYDYGRSENLIKYNQTSPPEYYVENIQTPVALLWSRNDLLADPADVGLLEMKLKNLVQSFCVQYPIFNHLDFVWGMNAPQMVYEETLILLNKF